MPSKPCVSGAEDRLQAALTDSAYARSRYQQTILNPEITPEATEACVNSLITHLQSLENSLELLQVENKELRQYTDERRARKKQKRKVLSKESVLTLAAAQELAATKEAAVRAKEEAKLARDKLRKKHQIAATLEKEQVGARKEAWRITANTKKLFILHDREAKNAVKVAKKAQKASDAAAKIARQKNTIEAQSAAVEAASQWQLHQSTAPEAGGRVFFCMGRSLSHCQATPGGS
jgi:hypothetical protein